MEFKPKGDVEVFQNNVITFSKNGKPSQNPKDKIFAKLVEGQSGKTYYIATLKKEIYNPLGSQSNREQYLNLELSKVSKDTFDFYLIYLQTNNSIYLTRANRRFIND